MWICSSLYRFFIASSKFIIHQEDFQHFSWFLIRGLGHPKTRSNVKIARFWDELLLKIPISTIPRYF
ncbi:hypothetical protein BWD12_19565 [Leptospira santarosai serovar Bananal]|nr:hypothetical protein BWD11_13675 [Leptospira santarosai serovar Grippotyphosa]ONF76068.1 hypothetical protein BWD12_19565 [Leptospira santarosai serovar Bananal]ONF83619.1 hypothetical protein BWD13_18185 [Leptospira santarosai serovar Grippotyphosa]